MQAYLDVLDYDGMKSVLKEAQMLQIKDYKEVDPNDKVDLPSFRRIIDSQNLLLYGCNRLLYEIGKKFSFYLFPYGKDFSEIVKDINDLIKADWKVQIVNKSSNSITVEIENCIFCPDSTGPCELFTGFLIYSLKKALPDNRKVNYVNEIQEIGEVEDETFLLKLRWK